MERDEYLRHAEVTTRTTNRLVDLMMVFESQPVLHDAFLFGYDRGQEVGRDDEYAVDFSWLPDDVRAFDEVEGTARDERDAYFTGVAVGALAKRLHDGSRA